MRWKLKKILSLFFFGSGHQLPVRGPVFSWATRNLGSAFQVPWNHCEGRSATWYFFFDMIVQRVVVYWIKSTKTELGQPFCGKTRKQVQGDGKYRNISRNINETEHANKTNHDILIHFFSLSRPLKDCFITHTVYFYVFWPLGTASCQPQKLRIL